VPLASGEISLTTYAPALTASTSKLV